MMQYKSKCVRIVLFPVKDRRIGRRKSPSYMRNRPTSLRDRKTREGEVESPVDLENSKESEKKA